MDRVSSILPKVLKKRGMYDDVIAGFALKRSNEWIWKHMPKYRQALIPQKLERGSLVILAKDSAALMACSKQKIELLAYVHQEIPEETVSDIRLMRS